MLLEYSKRKLLNLFQYMQYVHHLEVGKDLCMYKVAVYQYYIT